MFSWLFYSLLLTFSRCCKIHDKCFVSLMYTKCYFPFHVYTVVYNYQGCRQCGMYTIKSYIVIKNRYIYIVPLARSNWFWLFFPIFFTYESKWHQINNSMMKLYFILILTIIGYQNTILSTFSNKVLQCISID